MARAVNAGCWHCSAWNDSAEHTIFACPRWNSLRYELTDHLGRLPSADDLPEIICGPDFYLLPVDAEEKSEILRNAEEAFRLLYKMIEDKLSLKEKEERIRQVTGRGARPP